MKLSKALKTKNKLVGEINELATLIRGHNVVVSNQVSKYDAKELYAKYLEKVRDLIALKTSIALANKKIQSYIFEIGELKARISFLKSINTREGKEQVYNHMTGSPGLEVVYTPAMDVLFIAQEVKFCEDRIETLQDLIDEHNTSVKISV